MPYRQTPLQAGQYYHIYNRGNNFQPIFLEPESYLFFLRRIREYFSPDAIEVVAYCLMPNHYHLLVHLNADDFSRVMQRLALSYTKAINQRFGRVGSLFQGRFRSVCVDRDVYLLHLSRYIHLNPVSASLVEKPEDWEYSSYRDYIGLRQGKLPNPGIVLAHFASSQAYCTFVDSYTERDRNIIAHLVLE